MHMDHRAILGPYVRVESAETLRLLLAYLGATPAQLAEFDSSNRLWGQGTVPVTLASGRKNLLRLRNEGHRDELASTLIYRGYFWGYPQVLRSLNIVE
jgi:hypothetical protein